MKHFLVKAYLFFVLAVLYSCSPKETSSERDSAVLAQVNSTKLYLNDIKNLIPSELKGSDSINFIRNYINNWVSHEQFYQQSLRYLNTEDINIDKELEEYKKDLLTHKFQTKLIEEKLDTTLTEAEILEYYETNSNSFILKNNIVKVFYIKMPKIIPAFDKFKKLCYANSPKEIEQLNSICVQYAINYFTNDKTWLLVDDIKKEIPQLIDVPEFNLQKGKIFEFEDPDLFYFLKIVDVKTKDNLSPINFERENIKSMIINQRKQQLIYSIKNNFLEEGKTSKEIIIY
jgi:hypothetical protein